MSKQKKITDKEITTPLEQALGACRVVFIYSMIFGAIINLLMLATPIYSMQVLDKVLGSYNKDTLLMLTLVIILALVVLAALQGARSFMMMRMDSWLESQLSPLVLQYTIRNASINKSSGNGSSQNLRELNTVRTFLTSPPFMVMLDTPWSIIFMLVLFALHYTMGLLAVIGGALLILVTVLNEVSTKKILNKHKRYEVENMKNTEQAGRNAEVIKVMGMSETIMQVWQDTNQPTRQLHKLYRKRSAFLAELTKFLRMTLQISVTGWGAVLCIQGEFSAGAIIASSSLIGRALAPFETAAGAWKNFVTARDSYSQLTNLFEDNAEYFESVELPSIKGSVELENVYYSAPGLPKPIVKGINMSLDGGEVLAIIGSSGSGKTTLSRLIIGGIKPSLGSARIDAADAFSLNSKDRYNALGYVPQDIELFSGSIKENIARMDPNALDKDVVAAAEFTYAHEMILKLPKGYDTQIGFAGSLLSGGQRQRIALARAFYGNPKLVVLDEPNSNLDLHGESALSDVISEAKKRKITTIIISHRTSIMSIVDKIMVMRDGVVAAFGHKDSVLAQLNGVASQQNNSPPAKPGIAAKSTSSGVTQYKLSTKT